MVTVLSHLRVSFQVRPQVRHEIDKKRNDQTVFFLTLIDYVQRFGQVLVYSYYNLKEMLMLS